MADVTSRLRLVVDSTGVDRAGRKLKDLRRHARDADSSAARLAATFRNLAGVLGAAFSVREVAKAVDSYRSIENQLKLVTSSARELKSVQDGVLAVANATGASLETTARLYANLERFAGQFLNTQKETLDLTRAINQAAAVSGASVTEASNAIRQLTQGLAGGILRAEEFNSVIENMPRLGEAIADGLGIGIGELRKQVNDGLITSDRLIKALQSQFGELNEEFLNTSRTLGQAVTGLGNIITVELGERLSGVQDIAVKALQAIGQNLDLLFKSVEAVTVALAAYAAVQATAFGVTAATTVAKTIAQLIALERALGATSLAMAVQGVALKNLQAAWAGLTAVIAANPIGAFAIALGVAGAALVLFGDRLDGSRKKLEQFDASLRDAFEAAGEELPERLKAGLNKSTEDLERFEEDYNRILSRLSEKNREVISGQLDPNRTGSLSTGLANMRKIAESTEEISQKAREASASIAVFREKYGDLPIGIADQINNSTKDLAKSFVWVTDETKRFNVAAEAAAKTAEFLAEKQKKLDEANAEAAKSAARVADQHKEIQRIFAQLETERQAILAPSDIEADIIRQTADLLNDQADYYASMGVDADKVARADAERIISTRRQNEALKQQERIEKEIAEQREIISAAALGEEDERIAREILRIRRETANLSYEEARALAAQNVDLEIQLDLIHEQRRIMEEPFDNLADNLTDAIINGGRAGVGGLKKIFGSFLSDLKRAFLYQVFNPLIQSLSSSLGGLFGLNIFTPGINGANPAVASGSLLAAARTNGARIGGVGLPGAALGFGGLSLGGASSVFGLASLIGPGNLGKLGANVGNFLGLGAGGTGFLSKSLANAGTFGGALGGIGGSLASGAIFGNSKAQSIGSSVGGIAGSFFGPLGSAVGSFLGGAIGSLFSGKPSDSAAGGGVNFGSFGVENLFAKGTVNTEARDELLRATSELARTLTQLTGATLAGSGISVQVGSRNGTRIISGAGGDVTTPVGNAQAARDEIVRQLAVSLRGGESGLVNLTKALAGAKVNVDSIISVLGTFSDVMEDSRVPVSKYAQALKELDAVLAQVTNSATVRAEAVALLRGQFEKDITEAIEEIKDPAIAGFRDLARELASVLSDAEALGVDTSAGSDVMELIGLTVSDFFEQAAQGGADVVELTTRLAELGQVLADLGIDADIATQALNKALATQRDLFNEQIQSDIGQFLNGPLDQLEKLLEAQKTRLDQAEALGADLSQVERLTALELRQFFEGLSESALNEVRDFLGLFEEAADSVARQLDLSRQDLQAKADRFGDFAQQFASLSTDFREKFIAATPRESLDILRGRATELLGQIGNGNESAAQALPQVLNQLVDSARQSFGNTKQFQEVLDFALGILGDAEGSALGVQSEAERQIAALDENNDLLGEIRDILKSTQAFNALLTSASTGGVASAGDLLALIQSGAGLTPSTSIDNAAALNVTALIGQSMQPLFNTVQASIDRMTTTLGDMPTLQRLQIDATDRASDAIVAAVTDVSDRLDRLEVLSKQQLAELQAA